MTQGVCAYCGAGLPPGSIGACPSCGRLAPETGERALGEANMKRWLAAPMGLILLGGSIALVLALVLAGLVASGWI